MVRIRYSNAVIAAKAGIQMNYERALRFHGEPDSASSAE